jgi:hypothetical protein
VAAYGGDGVCLRSVIGKRNAETDPHGGGDTGL